MGYKFATVSKHYVKKVKTITTVEFSEWFIAFVFTFDK
jgi:hypothetical protein